MIGSAVIVFREVLEAALIIAVVLGATRGIRGRGYWVLCGLGLGLTGAALVAAFAGTLSQALQGSGQELFNATVLLTAVAMLGWHNVWMSSHGRKLASQVKALGEAVNVGAKPLSALLVVTALAVLREGSETALFLYSLAAGDPAGSAPLLLGALLGLGAGAGVGVLLYRGLLRIPVRHFFGFTAWLVLLVAAGLASSAAGYLIQANLLPPLVPMLWDSSWLLSQHGWLGMLLHVLIGYNDRPAGMQLLFYLATLLTILTLMYRVRPSARPKTAPASVAQTTSTAATQ